MNYRRTLPGRTATRSEIDLSTARIVFGGKTGEKLHAASKTARQSLRLATLRCLQGVMTASFTSKIKESAHPQVAEGIAATARNGGWGHNRKLFALPKCNRSLPRSTRKGARLILFSRKPFRATALLPTQPGSAIANAPISWNSPPIMKNIAMTAVTTSALITGKKPAHCPTMMAWAISIPAHLGGFYVAVSKPAMLRIRLLPRFQRLKKR